jgi:PTS system nitrogen regulatory IIA component
MNTIATLLQPEDIVLDLVVSTKDELLDAIGLHMERSHGLPQRAVALDLARREQIGSTGLGEGVAIPHARFEKLDRILVAYIRLDLPIPFDAPDGKPVHDFLVLLVPKQAAQEHIGILAETTRMFSDRRFRARLRQCGNPLEVKQLFDAWT